MVMHLLWARLAVSNSSLAGSSRVSSPAPATQSLQASAGVASMLAHTALLKPARQPLYVLNAIIHTPGNNMLAGQHPCGVVRQPDVFLCLCQTTSSDPCGSACTCFLWLTVLQVNTKVDMRFDIAKADWIPDEVKDAIRQKVGSSSGRYGVSDYRRMLAHLVHI
jgi:hypothetical protein